MKKILILLLVNLPFLVRAQLPLTLTGAIDTALQNNFDLQIVRNNTRPRSRRRW
jgi:hypothetical protein